MPHLNFADLTSCQLRCIRPYLDF